MDLVPTPGGESVPHAVEPTLEEKVRIQWDERQITDVLHRYSRGFDRCDMEIAKSADVSYDRPLQVTRERTDVVAS
jgi:hypothetical protein